jgi:hypothetical protein
MFISLHLMPTWYSLCCFGLPMCAVLPHVPRTAGLIPPTCNSRPPFPASATPSSVDTRRRPATARQNGSDSTQSTITIGNRGKKGIVRGIGEPAQEAAIQAYRNASANQACTTLSGNERSLRFAACNSPKPANRSGQPTLTRRYHYQQTRLP